MTQGSAPTLSVSFDPMTNHQNGQTYDANGNVTTAGQRYDVENRLLQATGYYTYDPSGKRVKKLAGTEEFYFYGIGGQKLATTVCVGPEDAQGCTAQYNVYFGGKLVKSNGAVVATDRLGSVRATSTGDRMTYYPYGEERTSTADGREKFGTYMRDSVMQDYADQRYYAVGMGRFGTADPLGLGSVDSKNPTSWNRYGYVGGDPINFGDPTGMLYTCDAEFASCDDNVAGVTMVPYSGGGGNAMCSLVQGFGFVPVPIASCYAPAGDGGDSDAESDSGSRRRTYFLKVRANSDCYNVPTDPKGVVTRDISYDLYFLEAGMSTPMFSSHGVISEHLVGLNSVAGSSSVSNGPPGTYEDQQSILLGGPQAGVQTFTVQLDTGSTVGLAIAAFGGTVINPIAGLNIEKHAGYVSINGDIGGKIDANGKLIAGSYTPCK